MEGYSLLAKPSVAKDLDRIPGPMARRVRAKILGLSKAPLPEGTVKLAGTQGHYRVRVGDYRIIYQVDHRSREITINYIRHRREVYRSL